MLCFVCVMTIIVVGANIGTHDNDHNGVGYIRTCIRCSKENNMGTFFQF